MIKGFTRGWRMLVGNPAKARREYKRTASRTERRRVNREVAAFIEPLAMGATARAIERGMERPVWATPEGARLNAWDVC